MYSDVWAPEEKWEVCVSGCVTAGRSKTWSARKAVFRTNVGEAQLTSLSLSEDEEEEDEEEEEEPESCFKGDSMAQLCVHAPSGSPC